MSNEHTSLQTILTMIVFTAIMVVVTLVVYKGGRSVPWERTPKVDLEEYEEAPVTFFFPDKMESVERQEVDDVYAFSNPHENFKDWFLGKNEGVTVNHYPNKKKIKALMRKYYEPNIPSKIRTDMLEGKIYYSDGQLNAEYDIDEVTDFTYDSLMNDEKIIDLSSLCEPISSEDTKKLYSGAKWVNNWAILYSSNEELADIEFESDIIVLPIGDDYERLANPTKENMKTIVNAIIARLQTTYNTSTECVDIEYERSRIYDSIINNESKTHEWKVKMKQR